MSSPVFRLLGLALALGGANRLSAAVYGDRSIGEARIAHIATSPTADLVVLDEGFGVGLRTGMVCRVTRGETKIAELLLVDLRFHAAIALILDLTDSISLQSGDVVAVKTVSSRK